MFNPSIPHLFPDTGGLQDTSIAQLQQHLVRLKQVWALHVVGTNAPEENKFNTVKLEIRLYNATRTCYATFTELANLFASFHTHLVTMYV